MQARKEGSVIKVSQAILREEGFRGFYKGLGANLSFIVFEKALKLAANDYFRSSLGLWHYKTPNWKKSGKELPAYLSALAGKSHM